MAVSRLSAALAIVIAFAIAGAIGTVTAARSVIRDVRRVPGVGDVLSPSSSTVENFLLVGSDSRAGSDPTSSDYGGIGSESEVSGTRSDTIMLLRRDRATGEAALLSIPRDLWVDIPGQGKGRINGAFNSGPQVLVQTVQTALGLPVHHYVEVDFNGFKSLVDAIGGVELCFLYPTRDVNTGLNVPVGGCYELDGVGALAYARSRYYEQYIDGDWRIDGTADIGRTARQRDFVNRAMTGALADVKSNPFTAGSIVRSGVAAVGLDEELDVLKAAGSLRTAAEGGLGTWALPVRGETIEGKSVLLLTDDAQGVLSWFAGTGPMPAPQS